MNPWKRFVERFIIRDLMSRVDALESKSPKQDRIGFSIDCSESMDSERQWDNTGAVGSWHYEGD
jgi:hypothetical protein